MSRVPDESNYKYFSSTDPKMQQFTFAGFVLMLYKGVVCNVENTQKRHVVTERYVTNLKARV